MMYAIIGLFIYPLIAARLFITTWNNTTVGNSQFKTDCNQWRFAWIVASNWVVKIFNPRFNVCLGRCSHSQISG